LNAQSFSTILIDSIKHRYGRLIPSTRLASEIDRVTNGEVSLSSEAVRKWLRGLSLPNGSALVALDFLLGEYFVEKRKLKIRKYEISESLNQMNLQDLIEVQGLIHTRIESTLRNDGRGSTNFENLSGKK